MPKIEGSYCDISSYFYMQDNLSLKRDGFIIRSKSHKKTEDFLFKLLRIKVDQTIINKFQKLGYNFIENTFFLIHYLHPDLTQRSELKMLPEHISYLNSRTLPPDGVLWYEEGNNTFLNNEDLLMAWLGWHEYSKQLLKNVE